MRNITQIFRNIAGLFFLPGAAIFLYATCLHAVPVLKNYRTSAYFLGGAAVYFLAALILYVSGAGRGSLVYTTGHELTHGLAAVLTRVHILGKIKITRFNGGSIRTDGTNSLISLAPYFIPFYTLFAAWLYLVISYVFPGTYVRPYFLAATGFTLAFHIYHNTEMLADHVSGKVVQSDIIKAGGALFASPFIIILNCAAVLLALKCLFPEVISLKKFFISLFTLEQGGYRTIYIFMSRLFSSAGKAISHLI